MFSAKSLESKVKKDFASFTKELGPVGRQRFVRAKDGTKRPLEQWKGDEKGHHPENVGNNSLIKSGHGLLIIDIDDWQLVPKDMRDLLEEYPTLTVQSPHANGWEGHYYFAIDECPFQKEELSEPWGEIKHGMLAVTPGSEITDCKHGCCSPDSPGRYTIRHDQPIQSISADELPIETKPETETYPVDSEKVPFNVGDRLEKGRNCSEKLDLLCEWAEGKASPSDVGFANDRSRAECSLAWHLAFWFGRNEKAVRHVMNRLNPPKWADEGDGYKDSVLDAIKHQPETYGGIEPSESGPSIELVMSVWFDLMETGDMSTAEVAESVQWRETQIRKALDYLEDREIVEYKRDGRSAKWHLVEKETVGWDEIGNELNSLEDSDQYLMEKNLRLFGTDCRE